jgi:predicted nucleotidyltransferase
VLLAVVYRSFTRGDWREESHVDFPVVAEGLPCTYRERWDLLFALVEGWKGPVKPAGEPVKAAVRVLAGLGGLGTLFEAGLCLHR